MKKYLPVFLFIFILSFNVNAQLIDGPANIRGKPDGKLLFSINDNVPVDYRFYQSDWYLVTFTVVVPETCFLIENVIAKETKLYDSTGNEIGKALDNISVSKEKTTYHPENHTYTCVLEGYTFKNNLKDSISTLSIAERIKAPNKKCGSLVDIAKAYIQMNQKDNAVKILDQLLQTVDTIGPNPDFEGNSYGVNDEKAYQLRDIALLYFKMGNKAKAIEVLNNAIVETKNIQGACDQYVYRDKALEDFALDLVDFGEYERSIKTIKMASNDFFSEAASEITNKYLAKDDITTAKRTVELIRQTYQKERTLLKIYFKEVNFRNIDLYIRSIKSFKDESIKCSGLAELAVRYYQIEGGGNKITSALLNESLEIAQKIKDNYQRDDLFAEIAGRYAEVKQFEKGKALALKIDWSISRAKGLMDIAIQYRKIKHLVQTETLLDQAWDITAESEEGLDQIEMFQALVGAYGVCGLLDKSLVRAKTIGYDPQFYNDALLMVALYYSRNKQPAAALNVLRDFDTDVRDQMKAGAIGDIIGQLTATNKKEEAMRVLAGATEMLDSIADRDWKYLIGLKNEAYTKIALKYVKLKEYDRAIQIIDQKIIDYDVKVSASVKAILMYNKINKEINQNREDFINRVSSLTL